jgi:hypothetical protein
MTEDPLLAALIDEYGVTLERLQRSFVGPPDLQPPKPVPAETFARQYSSAAGDGADESVRAFRELQDAAREGAGMASSGGGDGSYEQYVQWLPFAYRNEVVLGRIADALGYDVA